jgi:hypothetical protein
MIPSYLFQHTCLSRPTDVPNLWKFIMSMNLMQTYEAHRTHSIIYKPFIINTLCNSMCPMCLCVSKKMTYLFFTRYLNLKIHLNISFNFSKKPLSSLSGLGWKLCIFCNFSSKLRSSSVNFLGVQIFT